jgi:diadenosine tetraphosphate (Ap4A) HIT family hydrolase
MVTSAPDCLICRQEQADPDDVVFADDDWSAGVIAGYDVPGWVVLRLRRHAEGFGQLTEAELAQFGRRARDTVAAVRTVTGAAATYLIIFGEANPHLHALITPRTADIAEDRRLGDILKLRTERNDAQAARALVPALRTAYRNSAAAPIAATPGPHDPMTDPPAPAGSTRGRHSLAP